MSTIRSPKSRPPLFNLTLVMLFALISSSWSAGAQTIPSDAKPLCPVSSATFASWFQTGAPSLNGVVNPADSLHFPDVPNCSFYQWSMQMFLWLTSPTPITYGGGGGRIFDSKPFFDVSPLDNTNHRHFLAHNEGFLRVFNLQAGFLGPHHLPVIFSKTHGMLEIEEAPRNPGGKPLVINRSGVAV